MKRSEIIFALLLVFLSFETIGQASSWQLIAANGQDFNTVLEKELFLDLSNERKVDHKELLLAENKKTTRDNLLVNKSEVDRYIRYLKLKRKKIKNDKKFVNFLFYKTHKKYLKNYKTGSLFYDLLSEGDYDCVSGTAMYAILLDGLGINYIINEFDYHVSLTVRLEGEQILLESTDPLGGYVDDEKAISERLQKYTNDMMSNGRTGKISSDFLKGQLGIKVRNDLNLRQLAGLQYYNKAVNLYNRRQPVKAWHQLSKCIKLYQSDRVKGFATLILDALLGDPAIDQLTKDYFAQIKYNNLTALK